MNPKTRDKLLAWLAENPGSSRVEMAKAIGMTTATVGNITRTLEACQVIHVSGTRKPLATTGGVHTSLYSVGKPKTPVAKINKNDRKLLACIKKNPNKNAYFLSSETGICLTNVYRHINQLQTLNMVYVSGYGYPENRRKPALYKAGRGENVPYPKKEKHVSKPRIPRSPKKKAIRLPVARRVSLGLVSAAGNPFGVLMAQMGG